MTASFAKSCIQQPNNHMDYTEASDRSLVKGTRSISIFIPFVDKLLRYLSKNGRFQTLSSLMPRRKERFCYFLRKRDKATKLLDNESPSQKSFSILTTLDSLEWLNNTFKSFVATPKTNCFFLENHYDDYHCIWVRKTKNHSGHFRLTTMKQLHVYHQIAAPVHLPRLSPLPLLFWAKLMTWKSQMAKRGHLKQLPQ